MLLAKHSEKQRPRVSHASVGSTRVTWGWSGTASFGDGFEPQPGAIAERQRALRRPSEWAAGSAVPSSTYAVAAATTGRTAKDVMAPPTTCQLTAIHWAMIGGALPKESKPTHSMR